MPRPPTPPPAGPGTTTTTTVGDTPPQIGAPAVTPTTIATTNSSGGRLCTNPSLPTLATITFTVTDDDDVSEIGVEYVLLQQGNVVHDGLLDVQGPTNGVYRAQLRDLPRSAVPELGGDASAVITISARDSAGQDTERQLRGLVVRRCLAP